MYHKHPPGHIVLEGVNPLQQSGVVGVAAHAHQIVNLGFHGNGLPEELQLFGALQNNPAQGAGGLEPHKHHRAFPAPQIVLEMVADSPGFAHAAGGDNDLGLLVCI